MKYLIDENLLEVAVDWISNSLEPDDVFSQEKLEQWALDNGFVEE